MTTEEFVLLMIRWGNLKAKVKSRFQYTEYAKRNEKLRDKYRGKRCFILGNGESLRQKNLALLKDEVVFVTNGFYKCEACAEVEPNYYLLVDDAFFKGKLGHDLLAGIECLKEYEHKPEFIVPYSMVPVIQEDYKWNRWTNVYYIDAGMSFHKGYNKQWDMTQIVAAPQCVVQVAMLAATFMGFEEIYLLGVEQTNIFDTINMYLGIGPSNYVYAEEKSSDSWMQLRTLHTLDEQLRGYARIFELYKEIYRYCRNMGVEIYNCTPESLIDSIPKKEYESLF